MNVERQLNNYKIKWLYAGIREIRESFNNPTLYLKENNFLCMLKRDSKIDVFQFLLVNLVNRKYIHHNCTGKSWLK